MQSGLAAFISRNCAIDGVTPLAFALFVELARLARFAVFETSAGNPELSADDDPANLLPVSIGAASESFAAAVPGAQISSSSIKSGAFALAREFLAGLTMSGFVPCPMHADKGSDTDKGSYCTDLH